jgi:hypothetical protein
MQPWPDDGEAAPASRDQLAALCEDFPQYRIWRENVYGRHRYVARSQHLSVNPHTVITDDPDELRAALSRPE